MEIIEVLRFIAPIFLGGVIGAFTNYLAIKMMFRPYTEKRIFGFVIPFTPGIIPKRQNELGKAIGRVVSENLVDADGISKMLLSEETISKLNSKLEDVVSSLRSNNESVESFLGKYAGEERISALKNRIKGGIEEKIERFVSDDNIGKTIAMSAMSSFDERTGSGFVGLLTKNMLVDSIKDKLTPKLAGLINDVLRVDGKKMILATVDTEIDGWSNSTVSSWASQLSEERVAAIKNEVVKVYSDKVTSELPRLLKTIDISRVVEEKIQSMDMPTVEHLVLDVANNELSMLVWLGGLLGAIIGIANIFFMI